MKHRLGAAACVVAGLALLSGCTPAELPLAAVWPGADGRPVVTLRPCDGDRATHLWLLSSAEDAFMEGENGELIDTPPARQRPRRAPVGAQQAE